MEAEVEVAVAPLVVPQMEEARLTKSFEERWKNNKSSSRK